MDVLTVIYLSACVCVCVFVSDCLSVYLTDIHFFFPPAPPPPPPPPPPHTPLSPSTSLSHTPSSSSLSLVVVDGLVPVWWSSPSLAPLGAEGVEGFAEACALGIKHPLGGKVRGSVIDML